MSVSISSPDALLMPPAGGLPPTARSWNIVRRDGTKAVAEPASTKQRGSVAICRGCKQLKTIRSRHLCRSCYEILDEREKQERHQGSQEDVAGDVPVGEPTAFLPGSPGKAAVFRERARLNLALFHPDDARPTPEQWTELRPTMQAAWAAELSELLTGELHS